MGADKGSMFNADGRSNAALLDRLSDLEAEKATLDIDLDASRPEPVRIHPNAAELYVAKVRDLRDSLGAEDARDEAAAILRTLIEEITLHPVDGELRIEIRGELATLLAFAQSSGEKARPGSLEPGRTESLVAGARYPLCRNRRVLPWRRAGTLF